MSMHPYPHKSIRRTAYVVFVLLSALILYTCVKIDPAPKLLIATGSVTDVGGADAKATGMLSDFPGEGVSDHGFCWSTLNDPSLKDEVRSLGETADKGEFSGTVDELTPGTRYYIRAYASRGNETIYGDTLSFETLNGTLPELDPLSVSELSENSVKVTGKLSDDGGLSIEAIGICWSTSTNPDTSDSLLQLNVQDNTISETITGLSCSTPYFLRAFATNPIGTSYSEQVDFITHECSSGLPEVSTTAISSITESTAFGGGTVGSDGGSAVTARGVCWSTSPEPTTMNAFTKNTSGVGIFSSTLTGLQCGTLYYVRAYATNSVGTKYGNERTFTTSSCPLAPSVSTSAISNIQQYSASGGGTVNSDGGSPVTERGICWSVSSMPTIKDSHLSDRSGTGSFQVDMTGLGCATTYYVRAYARNEVDLSYGNEQSFTTSDCPSNLPVVSTNEVSEITQTTATSGGKVTDDGGASISDKGICWNTSGSPTINDESYSAGSGADSFTGSMTGLDPGTTYFVRAYATNDGGANYGYGADRSFTTDDDNTVKDYDGNVYPTVEIGKQVWMAENLKTTHYADGFAISHKPETSQWASMSYSDRAYCWYDNSTKNRDDYGAMYTWAAAMRGTAGASANPSGIQGVCPDGWHMPSDDEWKELEKYLGMTQNEADGVKYRGTTEGGEMKEAGYDHWFSPNTEADNTSGFTGLPGGLRGSDGIFKVLGSDGFFWSTTISGSTASYYRALNFSESGVYRYDRIWENGMSVRCVKD